MTALKAKSVVDHYVGDTENSDRVVALRLKRTTYRKLEQIVKKERKTTVSKFIRAMIEKFVDEYEGN